MTGGNRQESMEVMIRFGRLHAVIGVGFVAILMLGLSWGCGLKTTAVSRKTGEYSRTLTRMFVTTNAGVEYDQAFFEAFKEAMIAGSSECGVKTEVALVTGL